jgi:hypothetical protein
LVFSYQQSNDKAISDDLKMRHHNEIAVLEKAGFSFFSLHRETIWPFSVIFFFPIYLMMAAREYTRIEPPLRITSYHLMYFSKEKATLAYIYGLGCKFYSRFSDGTWLVSNTVQSIRDEKIEVVVSALPAAPALENHEIKIRQRIEGGKRLAAHVTFDSWAEADGQFDQRNLVSLISMGLVWMGILAWLVSWLLRNGLGLI